MRVSELVTAATRTPEATPDPQLEDPTAYT
jgi:hypothetical protein